MSRSHAGRIGAKAGIGLVSMNFAYYLRHYAPSLAGLNYYFCYFHYYQIMSF